MVILGRTAWFWLIFWFIDFHFITADPCLTYEEFKVDYRRYPDHVEDVYEENLCDALVRQKWYRFVEEVGGGDMTNDKESVASYGCGTYYSLWMNGSIPDTDEGIVDRKVCMKSVFADCHSSFTIQVKNCCSYRVYFLQSATACPSAYCVSPSNISTENCTDSPAGMSSTTTLSPTDSTTTSKQGVSTSTSLPATTGPNMVSSPRVTVSERTPSTAKTGSDPCLTYEEFKVDYRRYPDHVEDVYAENLCDALVRQKWYRFVEEAGGGDMTNDRESVASYGCGTHYSLWMNGSLPDTDEGIVDRKVCMKSVFADCHSSFTVQVKNCCSYRVYFLQSATSCPSSYCVSPSNIIAEHCTDSSTTTLSTTESTTTSNQRVSTNTATTPASASSSKDIIMVVCVVLLVLFIGSLTVFFYMRHKRQKGVPDSQQAGNTGILQSNVANIVVFTATNINSPYEQLQPRNQSDGMYQDLRGSFDNHYSYINPTTDLNDTYMNSDKHTEDNGTEAHSPYYSLQQNAVQSPQSPYAELKPKN